MCIIIHNELYNKGANFEKSLESFVTKEQIANLEKNIEKFATKEQLKALEDKIDIKFSNLEGNLEKCTSEEQVAVLDTTIKWVAGIICTTLITGFATSGCVITLRNI